MIRAALAECLLLPATAWAQSPFAGTWRGGWRDGITGQSGPAALVVGEEGSINGQVGNRVLRALAPVSGHVEPGGAMALTYTYDQSRTRHQRSSVPDRQIVGSFRRASDRTAR